MVPVEVSNTATKLSVCPLLTLVSLGVSWPLTVPATATFFPSADTVTAYPVAAPALPIVRV